MQKTPMLALLVVSVAALAGCNKSATPEPAPGAPTATATPALMAPASAPASDPSLPNASSIVSSPASAGSAP